MTNNNQVVKWIVISLAVLLLIPLVAMLGMMIFGSLTGSGMMSQMGSMMTGGMGAAAMGLCVLWLALLAGALVLLIVMLTRHARHTEQSRGV